MTLNWEIVIAYYYFIMWMINFSAYSVGSWAIYQWHLKLFGLKSAISLPKFSLLMGTFAVIRFGSGLVAVTKYLDGTFGPIEAILTLGIISVFLNTCFIVLFAGMATHDAKRLTSLTEQDRATYVATFNAFRELRKTIHNTDNPDKS